MAGEKAFGTTVGIGSGILSTTPTYTTIAQVRDAGSLPLAHVMADITAHDSPAGWAEQIPSGKKESIEIPLVLIFDQDEATHDNASGGVLHAFLNDTPLAYKITYPDSTNWTFDAYITNFEEVVGTGEDALVANVTIGVTSTPTYAAV